MKRLSTVAVIFLLFIYSCSNDTHSASGKDSTMTSGSSSMNPAAGSMNAATGMLEKNRATALASVQSFVNHDAAAVIKDIAPDFVDYGDGSTPPVKGMDSCKAMIQSFMTAFPDIKGENFMTIAEGNHVAVFGDWSGTFKGKLMNMAPTGKTFRLKDVDLFTFNNAGQITEHRNIQSNETMMQQVLDNKKGK